MGVKRSLQTLVSIEHMKSYRGLYSPCYNTMKCIPVSVLTHVGGSQAVVEEGQLLSLLFGLTQHLIEWKNVLMNKCMHK